MCAYSSEGTRAGATSYHLKHRKRHAKSSAVVGGVDHPLIGETDRPRGRLGTEARFGMGGHVGQGDNAAPYARLFGKEPIEDAEDGLRVGKVDR